MQRLAAYILFSLCLLIITDASRGIAANYTDLSSVERPSWDRVGVGTKAYIDPDEVTGGKYVCDSVAALGTTSLIGCLRRPNFARVAITSKAYKDIGPGHDDAVRVQSIDAGWSGYIALTNLEPFIPLPLAMRSVENDDAPTEYRAARLESSPDEYDVNNPSAPVGDLIGNVPVLLLRYHDLVGGKRANAPAFIRVLAGKYKGHTGWIDTLYLAFGKDLHIGCFC